MCLSNTLFSPMVNFEWPSNHNMPSIRDNDHQQGSDSATILLMEYGDYPCHQSAEAHTTVQNIQLKLGQHLCFIYRHFPASPLSVGWKASEAVEAAGAQGRFWDMHDTLYQNTQRLDDGDLVEYADQLQLNIPQFLKEMNAHTHHDRIQEDYDSGVEVGVEQTPTFFVSVRQRDHTKLAPLIQKILEASNTSPSNS